MNKTKAFIVFVVPRYNTCGRWWANYVLETSNIQEAHEVMYKYYGWGPKDIINFMRFCPGVENTKEFLKLYEMSEKESLYYLSQEIISDKDLLNQKHTERNDKKLEIARKGRNEILKNCLIWFVVLVVLVVLAWYVCL